MLAELVDRVIGIDPDRDNVTAAVIDAHTTGVIAVEVFAATASGYDALFAFVDEHSVPGERVFAVEGTGSYGAGVTRVLQQGGEWVIEFDRATTKATKDCTKTDALDAIRAAREVLGRDHLAEPRTRGAREAIRARHVVREAAVRARTAAINELKALIVTAPINLRDQLRSLSTTQLVTRCAALRCIGDLETHHVRAALRALARRIQHLDREIADHDTAEQALIQAHAPQLLAELGVGHVTAAQLLISWSHPGRCRSEAAFARLAGASPIEASSGQTKRHRLNRSGDRQLNRALHTIATTKMRYCPDTQAYTTRRLAEGKTKAEIRRCIKRYLARHLYRILEHPPAP